MAKKKKSSAYWKKRFSDLENSQNQYGQNTFHQIESAFDKAQRQIQAQIESWYARYADNNRISMAEARRQLSAAELKELRWDVQEYIKYGQENALNQKWTKELENASARFHISRLEALKLRTQQSLEVAFGNELDSIDDMMKNLYQSGYYHTCFEVQKGFNLGWEIGQIDERKLQKIISKPWASDGITFSDRVWKSKTSMVNELHQQLTRTIIQGKAPDEAIRTLSKYVADKTKNAKYAAGRLVMTEQAFISSAAQKDAFNDLDVEEFEIVATLDSHTSEICQNMDGQHFPMKDFEPGVTAPPFHVWCRSTTVPYFDDEWGRSGERAARGEDGKTYYVPSDMTYPEWQKSFVDGGDKAGLQETKSDESGEDAIADFTTSRKEYDEKVQKLYEMEKETDATLDAYMDAIDTPDEARLEELHSKKYDELERFREIVKDLKATLSGKEAKAVRQVEKNFADLTGIPANKVEMTGLQYDTAEMIYDSYDIVLKKFPELKGNLERFSYDGVHGDAYASCMTLTGEIQAHGIFAKYDNLVKQYADDVAAGFHPVGTDYRSIIVHELGHALDGYMTKKRLLGADFNQYGIVSTSSNAAKDMTLKMLGFDRQEIVLELKNQGLKTWDRFAILEQKEREFISKHVSGYATGYDSEGNKSTKYPEREFFAECFAEYVMSSKPRKAAQIFGEIIETALGR